MNNRGLIIALIGIVIALIAGILWSTSQIIGTVERSTDRLSKTIERSTDLIREDISKLHLTVQLRTEPTPLPSTVITPVLPTVPIEIKITEPKEKENVAGHYMVRGSSNITPQPGLNIYVLTSYVEVEKEVWWVQPNVTHYADGTWETYAYFIPLFVGRWKICAIATTERLVPGQTLQEFPGLLTSNIIYVTTLPAD